LVHFLSEYRYITYESTYDNSNKYLITEQGKQFLKLFLIHFNSL